MRTLGIIGGLGPLAGAHFYRRLIELTPAGGDADHLSVVLISDPAIPSRLLHLSGRGPSPVPRLIQVANRLIQAGANILAMPSTTTSYYEADIQRAIAVPLISLLTAVRDALKADGVGRIGILATTPTRDHHIYEALFDEAGIAYCYPDATIQERVMDLIAAVKGDGRARTDAGQELAQCLTGQWADSADAVLLGCTELPVVWDSGAHKLNRGRRVYSATDILAERVLKTLHPSAAS